MEIAVNYYLCVLDRIWHIEEIFFTNKVGSQELLGCNLFFNLEINNCIKHSAFSYVLVQKKKKKRNRYTGHGPFCFHQSVQELRNLGDLRNLASCRSLKVFMYFKPP